MRTLKRVITIFILLSTAAAQQTTGPVSSGKLSGRWRVTFSLTGDPEKHIIFEVKPKGAGSFVLLDTGPDNKAVADPAPAVWSELENDRVSFAGQTEMQL